MYIRKYQPNDCEKIIKLFSHTVHTVNAHDYTKEQLDAWAPKNIDIDQWNQSFQEHNSFVVFDGELMIGFGDMDKTGYLDRLYVHADYQGRGIATAICNQLEEAVQGNIVTNASITAVPFFKKRGYRIIKEQNVERQGVFLTNFLMEKDRKFFVGD